MIKIVDATNFDLTIVVQKELRWYWKEATFSVHYEVKEKWQVGLFELDDGQGTHPQQSKRLSRSLRRPSRAQGLSVSLQAGD